MNNEIAQRKEIEVKSNAELALFKKRNHKLSKQNKVLKGALGEMTRFFQALDVENQ